MRHSFPTRRFSDLAFAAALGGDHQILVCNRGDPSAVDALVGQAVEALGGKIDILVNNAGITRDNLILRMKDEEWSDVISVNLEAAFRLARAAAKPMMKARFGRIISITRSEEHTSALQSLMRISYAVFCLKKKK